MKKLIAKNTEACIGCRSCEAACAKAYYKTDDLSFAVIEICGQQDGSKISVCNQCGKCADVCPVEAISQNAQGVYMIDRKACIGCLACMDICPPNLIRKSHDNAFVTKCAACGLCVRACPEKLLEIATE